MKLLSVFSDVVTEITPPDMKPVVTAIKREVVKVVSYQTQEFSYFIESIEALYCGNCTDLGLWDCSTDE